jgi:hypothetical protein
MDNIGPGFVHGKPSNNIAMVIRDPFMLIPHLHPHQLRLNPLSDPLQYKWSFDETASSQHA